MSSVNKVILVGNLGKDPETRTFPSGDQIANVSLATTDKWKDKQTGEQRESTEWHRLVFSGRLAEIAAQYLRKGSQVYVEGSIRYRKYTDQSGVEKYSTEIRVEEMRMLGSRQDGGGQRDDGYGQPQQQQRRAPAPAPAATSGQNSYAAGRGRSQPPTQQRQQPQNRSGSGFDDMDDDIPF